MSDDTPAPTPTPPASEAKDISEQGAKTQKGLGADARTNSVEKSAAKSPEGQSAELVSAEKQPNATSGNKPDANTTLAVSVATAATGETAKPTPKPTPKLDAAPEPAPASIPEPVARPQDRYSATVGDKRQPSADQSSAGLGTKDTLSDRGATSPADKSTPDKTALGGKPVTASPAATSDARSKEAAAQDPGKGPNLPKTDSTEAGKPGDAAAASGTSSGRRYAYAAGLIAAAFLAAGAGSALTSTFSSRAGGEISGLARSQDETRQQLDKLGTELAAVRQQLAALDGSVKAAATDADLKTQQGKLAALEESMRAGAKTTPAAQQVAQTQIQTQLQAQATRIAQITDRLEKLDPQGGSQSGPGAQNETSPTGLPKPQPSVVGLNPSAPAKPRPGMDAAGNGDRLVPPASIPTPAPVAAPKPDPRTRQARGWVLRDFYDGVAVIEGRRGVIEVVPGQTVAGLGRIDRVERRRGVWVLMTENGYIPGYED